MIFVVVGVLNTLATFWYIRRVNRKLAALELWVTEVGQSEEPTYPRRRLH